MRIRLVYVLVLTDTDEAIIASQSTYFYSLVRWKWKEESDGVVNIQDISSSHFEKILKFLYTHSIFFEEVTEALEFMELAEFFNIEALHHKVQIYLDYALTKNEVAMTKESVCVLWNYSADAKCERSQERCKEFLSRNFLECSRRA